MSRSSTSSSDSWLTDAPRAVRRSVMGLQGRPEVFGPVPLWPDVAGLQAALARRIAPLAAFARRVPRGGSLALLIIVALHLLALVVFPEPVARETLRRKLTTLTRSSRPAVLIAGDSRALNGVIPCIVARNSGLPEDDVINMAGIACDSSAVRAACLEFADRLADKPVMLLSVSFFSVNDRATDPGWLSDEMLRSLPLAERRELVGTARTLTSCFLPERTLLRRAKATLQGWPDEVYFGGFVPKRVEAGWVGQPDWLDRQLEHSRRIGLYHDAKLDGIRWAQLERDVATICRAGVQVVLLDVPRHPGFLSFAADSEVVQAEMAFATRLRDLADREDLPLLQYAPEAFVGDADADALYADWLHVSPAGAFRLSQMVGRDLAEFRQTGKLVLAGDRGRTGS